MPETGGCVEGYEPGLIRTSACRSLKVAVKCPDNWAGAFAGSSQVSTACSDHWPGYYTRVWVSQ